MARARSRDRETDDIVVIDESILETMASTTIGHLREFDPNSSDWIIFKPRLENYFLANDIGDDVKKRAILLNLLSEEAYKLLRNLSLPKTPEELTYKNLTDALAEHFTVKPAIFMERYKFYTAKKDSTESPKEWIARLRSLAINCDFTDDQLKMVLRDIFVIGYDHGPVQDRLLEEKKAVSANTMVEIAASKLAILPNMGNKEIQIKTEVFHLRDRVKSNQSTRRPINMSQTEFPSTSRSTMPTPNATRTRQQGGGAKCMVCGRNNHFSDKCYFKNFNCNICNSKGHLATVCPEKIRRLKFNNNTFFMTEGNLQNNSDNDSKNVDFDVDFEDTVFVLGNNNNAIKPVILEVKINNLPFAFQLDTGASCSCISEQLYYDHFKDLKLNFCNKFIYLYNGDKINPIGLLEVDVKYKNIVSKIILNVIRNGGPPILGRDFLQNFEISLEQIFSLDKKIMDNDIKSKFEKLFSPGCGTFNKGTVSLKLINDNVEAKFFRPRVLPFAMREKVECEINRLLEEKIIYPINFSRWATPIVPVLKKNGAVRICGDFKITINPVIEIDQYPLPRIDELIFNLQGSKMYSKLDLAQAYQQVRLDEKSHELVTISTHKGLFRYTRLPYGVASAPGKFQKIMEALLQHIPKTAVFLDDILIGGADQTEHRQLLNKVLTTLEMAGFKLAFEKCEFEKTGLTYLGYKITDKGISTCESLTNAIKNAPIPNSVTTLKSFLGLINYYAKFVPNLSAILYPLYALLKKDSKWDWTCQCQQAFDKI